MEAILYISNPKVQLKGFEAFTQGKEIPPGGRYLYNFILDTVYKKRALEMDVPVKLIEMSTGYDAAKVIALIRRLNNMHLFTKRKIVNDRIVLRLKNLEPCHRKQVKCSTRLKKICHDNTVKSKKYLSKKPITSFKNQRMI